MSYTSTQSPRGASGILRGDDNYIVVSKLASFVSRYVSAKSIHVSEAFQPEVHVRGESPAAATEILSADLAGPVETNNMSLVGLKPKAGISDGRST